MASLHSILGGGRGHSELCWSASGVIFWQTDTAFMISTRPFCSFHPSCAASARSHVSRGPDLARHPCQQARRCPTACRSPAEHGIDLDSNDISVRPQSYKPVQCGYTSPVWMSPSSQLHLDHVYPREAPTLRHIPKMAFAAFAHSKITRLKPGCEAVCEGRASSCQPHLASAA